MKIIKTMIQPLLKFLYVPDKLWKKENVQAM